MHDYVQFVMLCSLGYIRSSCLLKFLMSKRALSMIATESSDDPDIKKARSEPSFYKYTLHNQTSVTNYVPDEDGWLKIGVLLCHPTNAVVPGLNLVPHETGSGYGYINLELYNYYSKWNKSGCVAQSSCRLTPSNYIISGNSGQEYILVVGRRHSRASMDHIRQFLSNKSSCMKFRWFPFWFCKHPEKHTLECDREDVYFVWADISIMYQCRFPQARDQY